MDVTTRIAALEQELARLKADLGPAEQRHSRRNLFRVGALAAGGTALAVAGARPAAAADGDPLAVGDTTVADSTTPTVLHYTTPSEPLDGTDRANVFLVTDGDPLVASAALPAAIAAYATRAVPVAVVGIGSAEPGWGGAFAGTQANLNLLPTGLAPDARPGAEAALGDIVNDEDGALWLCVAASEVSGSTITPGTFRAVAGPATAGALHLLDVPVRAFDTRPGAGNQGKLQQDAEYVVDLAARVGGESVIPAGATAVLVNLTATAAEAPGSLALFVDGVPYPGTSNLNFTTGADVANLAVSRVSAQRRLKVRAGGADSTVRTHVVVDVIGYYR